MTDKNIVEKIRKLLALAGNNPNEAERVQAMLKAQALLRKHDLEMADIAGDPDAAILINPSVKTDRWRVTVFGAVCHVYDCEVLGRGRSVFILGVEGRAQITVEIGRWLMGLIDQEAKRQYEQKLRNSFCLGAANRLLAKAIELKKREEFETRFAQPTQRNQLMRIADSRRAAVDKWKEEKKIKERVPGGGKPAEIDPWVYLGWLYVR